MTTNQFRIDSQQLVDLRKTIDKIMIADRHGIAVRAEKMLASLKRNPQSVKVGRYQALLKDYQRSCERYQTRNANLPRPSLDIVLPVIEYKDEIVNTINNNQVTVIAGETGSGKTTQLPQICLAMGRGVGGLIGHTQPRRIAARSVAQRIAEELHSEPGQQVAYKVRFTGNVSKDSYIKLMTDGILLAEMQGDRYLNQYDTLIIDEAHERNLNIDFLLGYVKNLLPKRPDLKLIITSATIDTERFARHFSNAPIIEVSGRTYPVEVRYRPLEDTEDQDDAGSDMQNAILAAIDELDHAHGRGDTLVFLSGERDIKDVGYFLKKRLDANNDEILPLFSRLSSKEQNRVFERGKKRRIILSTNVAETSLTVPGIKYVIDTGLARINRYNYKTKVQRLPIEKISRANADQRKGRCGRVMEGVCIRLYSEEDFESRPQFADPEIKRVNLASVILRMKALRLGHIEEFPFIDPPDQRYVKDGYKLLNELTAIDHHHKLTSVGQQLSRMPVDPKIGRMLIEAGGRNALAELLVIASALSIQDPRERPHESADAADKKHAVFQDEQSDFLFYLNLWNAFQEQRKHLSNNQLRKWCRSHYISHQRMREWMDVYAQLKDIIKDNKATLNQVPANYEEIHLALCTGLLGNIGYKKEKQEYEGARHIGFQLFPGSGLCKQPPKWIISAELIETHRLYAHIAAKIQPEWLATIGRHLTKHHYSEPHWERKAGHISAYEKVTLYGLVIIARKKINYEKISPIESREIFIREALVEQDFDCDAFFYRHNAVLIEEARAHEDKQRRRGILINEDQLYEFYDKKVPGDICNVKSFNKWIKQKEQSDREFLCLSREQIFGEAKDSAAETMRPDHIRVANVELSLEYAFDLGAQHDGVCAVIPVVLINQVPEYAFDWLVPGFLQEKITALIKALPKKYRRNFVPAPEYAKACMDALQPYQKPLIDAVTDQLQKMTGIKVPAEVWSEVEIPEYLHMSYKIIDDSGEVLATGRDLSALKQQCRGGQGAGYTQKLVETKETRQWDFGDLPEQKTVDVKGYQLVVYPAIVDQGDNVALQNFEQHEEARQYHKSGVCKLYRLLNSSKIKYLEKNFPDLQKIVLNLQSAIGYEALKKDLLQCVIEDALFANGGDIRSKAEFERRSDLANQNLMHVANQYAAALLEISTTFKHINRSIGKLASFAVIDSVNDIKSQLANLVYPGFIAAAGDYLLKHVPRYLKGVLLRLEKLERNPQKDQQRLRQLSPYWKQYLELRQSAPQSPNYNNELNQYHWLLEEMRISLFCQELGTRMKVSFHKLDEVASHLL